MISFNRFGAVPPQPDVEVAGSHRVGVPLGDDPGHAPPGEPAAHHLASQGEEQPLVLGSQQPLPEVEAAQRALVASSNDHPDGGRKECVDDELVVRGLVRRDPCGQPGVGRDRPGRELQSLLQSSVGLVEADAEGVDGRHLRRMLLDAVPLERLQLVGLRDPEGDRLEDRDVDGRRRPGLRQIVDIHQEPIGPTRLRAAGGASALDHPQDPLGRHGGFQAHDGLRLEHGR
jgi:hypothetical protein